MTDYRDDCGCCDNHYFIDIEERETEGEKEEVRQRGEIEG
jgi:hypothetical protein